MLGISTSAWQEAKLAQRRIIRSAGSVTVVGRKLNLLRLVQDIFEDNRCKLIEVTCGQSSREKYIKSIDVGNGVSFLHWLGQIVFDHIVRQLR